MMGALGIIAGGGDLPRAVAQSVSADGRKVFVMALTGSVTGEWLADFPHEWGSPGAPGQAFTAFCREGVTDFLLAGQVNRPKFSEMKLDTKGMLLLPRAVAAARQGDDALLRVLVRFFEDEGLKVISVAQAAPGLVCGEGVLGSLSPKDEHRADIAAAFKIVQALGALDVGQGAVVCDGLTLAVEAAEGTDAMLARIPQLRESLRGNENNRRGVLVKGLKPTQDGRTDMPVVGIATLRGAADAHLAGIALEAGASLILDKTAVAAEADRLGLFVVGIKP